MDDALEYLELHIAITPISQLVEQYRLLYPNLPLWHFLEDAQRQAMVYTNIIDQLKSRRTPTEVKTKFEELDLVLEATLPNPNMPALLGRAFDKITQYRRALIDFVKNYGAEFLNESGIDVETAATVSVNIGFPPSVSIGAQFTIKEGMIRRF